jgi:hypothetical protein
MPYIQVKGQILKFDKIGEGKNMRLSAIFTDEKILSNLFGSKA